jgi:hypothetical protein
MAKKNLIKATAKKKPGGKATDATAEAAATPSRPAPPAAAQRREPPTLRELLGATFPHRFPNPFRPETPPAPASQADSPPYFDTPDPGERRRLRDLLHQSFSMTAAYAAAEKAAAEKAAAEKAAAEKAAAEKAAAEKAAAEKAAAEKAAAEKAAAEKAAAEKAAALLAVPKPPRWTPTPEMRNRLMVAAAAGILLLLLISLVAASALNSGRFYLKSTTAGLEILRGRFAPLGVGHFITLPGVKAPEKPKAVYGCEEVYPIIFNHIVAKADALLERPGFPPFEEITRLVQSALPYASAPAAHKAAETRLAGIEILVLLYKAEVAVNRGSAADLRNARALLAQAAKRDSAKSRSALIDQKMSELEGLLAQGKSAPKPPAAPAQPSKPAAPPPPQH